jgi:cyclopropane-fatty-acyl-phospholipid synthase
MAPHYAETLRRWRTNLQDHLEDARQLGYSDEFLRKWNYYLCYCEAAFEERHVGVVQLVLDNHACRRDPLAIAHAAGETHRHGPMSRVGRKAEDHGVAACMGGHSS